jgi:hypothetical protein
MQVVVNSSFAYWIGWVKQVQDGAREAPREKNVHVFKTPEPMLKLLGNDHEPAN